MLHRGCFPAAASRGCAPLQRLGFSLGQFLCSEQGLRSATEPGLLPGTVSLQQAGVVLCHSAWAPHWDGFSAASRGCTLPQRLGSSLGWFLLLWSMGSRVCGFQWLQHAGSVVVAHGVGCPTAWVISLDQGSNPCPLHWQVDS